MTGESAWNDSRCHAERSEASMSGFLTAFGMTKGNVRNDKRKRSDSHCHAERSEASMSGFLAALAMTKDKCRTECCKTYTFICQSYNAT
jgi:hypothetical protein